MSVLLLISGLLMQSGLAGEMEKPHVVVVGGGLAGLSAAIEAVENSNADVTLLEKESAVGGNSAKASSGVNGCQTKVQERMGIKDSNSLFFSDTVSAGDNANDMNLVDALVHDSKESVEWLTSLGVNLDDVNICGGHSVARTHWIPSPKEGKPTPVGITIIRSLQAHLDGLIKKIEETQPERQVKVVTVHCDTTTTTVTDNVHAGNDTSTIDDANAGNATTVEVETAPEMQGETMEAVDETKEEESPREEKTENKEQKEDKKRGKRAAPTVDATMQDASSARHGKPYKGRKHEQQPPSYQKKTRQDNVQVEQQADNGDVKRNYHSRKTKVHKTRDTTQQNDAPPVDTPDSPADATRPTRISKSVRSFIKLASYKPHPIDPVKQRAREAKLAVPYKVRQFWKAATKKPKKPKGAVKEEL